MIGYWLLFGCSAACSVFSLKERWTTQNLSALLSSIAYRILQLVQLVPVLYSPKASSGGIAFNLVARQTNRNVISAGNSFGVNINIDAFIL